MSHRPCTLCPGGHSHDHTSCTRITHAASPELDPQPSCTGCPHARRTTHYASRTLLHEPRSIPLPTRPARPAGSTLSVSLVKPRPPWPSHPRAGPPRRLVGLPPLPHTAPPGCVACSQVALAGICRRACSFSASLTAFRARTSRVDARPSATATPCRITIR